MYEYRVESWWPLANQDHPYASTDTAALTQWLNGFHHEGWELMQVVVTDGTPTRYAEFLYYFRRPGRSLPRI